MKDRIVYCSPNGYTGILYGESSMVIEDPEGRQVLHSGRRTPNTREELKPLVDGFPDFIKMLREVRDE